ncbi:MAG: nucleoside recognition domain-containing protein [Gammaproteobacteria bacterium]|nr:nucleoside recognition domain-containing protein [Gammaproteobacteria bacterium]
MTEFADLILRSGRAAVEFALFILLPIMIVMLTMMRLLEAKGVLDRIVALVTPALRPLGVPGLGVFALLQVLFVSFAAPVATLTMMNKGGLSRRHIAATLALVFTAAQANVVFPMSAMGLNGPATLLISAAAAIAAAAITYHGFARRLPDEHEPPEPTPQHRTAEDTKGVLNVINHAGGEAFGIAIGALPLLVLSLLLVNLLRDSGAIGLLETLTAPVFAALDLPTSVTLPVITKAIAGGTAMMGISADMLQQGTLSTTDLNRIAGLLIHPFDVAGVAILMSAGPRVAAVVRPAIYGALVAIALRTILHLVIW